MNSSKETAEGLETKPNDSVATENKESTPTVIMESSGLATTDQKYVLKCSIKKLRKHVQSASGAKFVNDLVALIPEESTQRTMFFQAWLPTFQQSREDAGIPQEYFELKTILAPPIDCPCRMAICLANKDFNVPHLLVMTKGVQELLNEEFVDGKKVYVSVLPEGSDDTVMDGARDFDASMYETIDDGSFS